MALYDIWDVKNGFAYVLQFFSLISDDLGGVVCYIIVEQNFKQNFRKEITPLSTMMYDSKCNDRPWETLLKFAMNQNLWEIFSTKTSLPKT